nr:hypothetical protein CKG001_11950 [Bdellovibrio sp. CKG001]BFD62466.1 hypothetical protein BdHM001_11470 [Bdellovibrio sp. HM001]BFD67625.1 hypothetical protein HAGR004_26470 [Bdellovibrio sp. HAGR004]
MKFYIVTLATLLSVTTSFASTLSCKTPMQAFKLIKENNSVMLVMNDNANNNPDKVILRGKVSSIVQEGEETVFFYNPWNIEIRISNLDKPSDIYSGTIDYHIPVRGNEKIAINCVNVR